MVEGTQSERIGSADRATHEPSHSSVSRPDGGYPLRVLSLFAGIGGFDLGLERTGGFKTVAFCEIDPFCRRVLEKHWPDVPVYNDVRTFRGEQVAPINVICGGFPCQDVSIAGAAHGVDAGLDGERSGLWFEYARLIDELRPSFVVAENVDRLLSYGIDRILETLSALGYDAEWHAIPASAVGAPQPRERVWIIAYPSGERREGLLPSGSIGAPGQGWPGGAADLQRIAAAPFEPGDSFPQPLLRGVDDRPPHRVDRVRACGNAVVPQIPELIGHAILASLAA